MKRRVSPRTLFISLSLLCLLAIWLSLALGPVSLPMFDTLRGRCNGAQTMHRSYGYHLMMMR